MISTEMTSIRISDGTEIIAFGQIDKNGLIVTTAEIDEAIIEAIEERLGSYGQEGEVEVDGATYCWFTN